MRQDDPYNGQCSEDGGTFLERGSIDRERSGSLHVSSNLLLVRVPSVLRGASPALVWHLRRPSPLIQRSNKTRARAAFQKDEGMRSESIVLRCCDIEGMSLDYGIKAICRNMLKLRKGLIEESYKL
ncbi:hypothetical protein V1477_009320 [Vespula maculifrons]|uniref:Uncharacterized protein n=1 Tax=Vespula maculifrons TaxID=7453 RepID=A0ABD2C9G3_VESMC